MQQRSRNEPALLREEWLKCLTLDKPREEYKEIYQQFLKDINVDTFAEILKNLEEEAEKGDRDHQAFLDQKKKIVEARLNFDEYAKHEETFTFIENDVRRTFPDFSFYSEPAQFEDAKFLFYTQHYRERNGEQMLVVRHYDVMAQILFLYARLNGIGYKQGMNELLAPIYYVFQDAYLAFHGFFNLMNYGFFALFDQVQSNTKDGIRGLLNELSEELRANLPNVSDRLRKLKISPSMYGFRWIMTCMAHDLELDQVLEVWTAMLKQKRPAGYIINFGIAYLASIEADLLVADETQALRLIFQKEKDLAKIQQFMQKIVRKI